jgi:hypothetical protein
VCTKLGVYETAMSDYSSIDTILRPMQAKTAYNLCIKKDVLCVLLTNYGKSLIQLGLSLITAKVDTTNRLSTVLCKKNTLTFFSAGFRKIVDIRHRHSVDYTFNSSRKFIEI